MLAALAFEQCLLLCAALRAVHEGRRPDYPGSCLQFEPAGLAPSRRDRRFPATADSRVLLRSDQRALVSDRVRCCARRRARVAGLSEGLECGASPKPHEQLINRGVSNPTLGTAVMPYTGMNLRSVGALILCCALRSWGACHGEGRQD